MFNLAIFRKTSRDSAILFFSCAFGVIAFVVLFVWAMLDMGEELLGFVGKLGFVRKMLEMSFGLNFDSDISIPILFAICFAHATVMMLTWSVIIATSSRTTVGEIERGTADLLLSLPVNRAEVYISSSLVWMVAACLLAVCPIIGVWIGTLIFEIKEEIDLTRYFAPAVNLAALLIAIGGVTNMVSSFLNNRGPAIAIVVGVGICSMLLNLLEPFIKLFEKLRFLGLLNYFRPVDAVRTGEWPVNSILILLGLGLVTWIVGMVVFCRKDIPAA